MSHMDTHRENTVAPGDIVVAVDGSEHADRALRFAADQAALEGRRLVVMSVADLPTAPDWVDADQLWDLQRDALEHARGLADRGAAKAGQLHAGLPIEAFAEVGDPRAVLLELADRAGLLVLGSRGRGPVRSILLGSVSATVSKYAACPVVICRPADPGSGGRGVLVAADATSESVPVLEFAFAQASLRRLPLTVLHCFWDVTAAVASYRRRSGTDLPAPELDDLERALSESLAGLKEKYPDVDVSLMLEHGLVDETIVRHGQHWDLVVVGRHPVDSLGRVLIGSIATAVTERARTTVAVVPQPAPADED